ncbi:MAG: hypothetical protein SF123_19625 [Chloroflexota bacterium]|nr:hypothetical protein [Chloroflexota bacterium]
MARTNVDTGLSLLQWAQIVGIDPFVLGQIVVKDKQAPCRTPVFQSYDRGGTLGRDDIARAIQTAERMITHHLGFFPAPTEIVGDRYDFHITPARALHGGSAWENHDGSPRVVPLRFRHVLSIGTWARSLVTTSAVTYHDKDADGILDTFEVNVTTTLPPDELELHYVSTDRAGASTSRATRLRPVRYTPIAGGYRFNGHIALCTKPTLQSAYIPKAVELEDNAQVLQQRFITQVEVYRLTTSATGAARVYGDATDGAQNYQDVSVIVRNSPQGVIAVTPPALPTLNEDTLRALVLSYIAGIPERDGMMHPQFADAVAKLATGLLPSKSCGCVDQDAIMEYWRTKPTDNEVLADDELASPWGATRGAVQAWRQINHPIPYPP